MKWKKVVAAIGSNISINGSSNNRVSGEKRINDFKWTRSVSSHSHWKPPKKWLVSNSSFSLRRKIARKELGGPQNNSAFIDWRIVQFCLCVSSILPTWLLYLCIVDLLLQWYAEWGRHTSEKNAEWGCYFFLFWISLFYTCVLSECISI